MSVLAPPGGRMGRPSDRGGDRPVSAAEILDGWPGDDFEPDRLTAAEDSLFADMAATRSLLCRTVGFLLRLDNKIVEVLR